MSGRPQSDIRNFLPGFIPASLYVALMRHTIMRPASSTSPTPPSTVSVDFLAFCYQAKPTTPQLGPGTATVPDVCPQVRYWCLIPGVGVKQGSLTVQAAHTKENVLGYARVAESVDLRVLNAMITQDDNKFSDVSELNSFSSDHYVFNAMGRLRKLGILRSAMWDLERFQGEISRLRNLWQEEPTTLITTQTSTADKPRQSRSAKPRIRPFTEFFLCDFSSQEHPVQ